MASPASPWACSIRVTTYCYSTAHRSTSSPPCLSRALSSCWLPARSPSMRDAPVPRNLACATSKTLVAVREALSSDTFRCVGADLLGENCRAQSPNVEGAFLPRPNFGEPVEPSRQECRSHKFKLALPVALHLSA